MIEKEFIPPTAKRVEMQTEKEINAEIEHKTIATLTKYKNAKPEVLDRRLGELKREWNTERVLDASAAALIFASSIIGIVKKNPARFILPGLVSFILEHAIQGW